MRSKGHEGFLHLGVQEREMRALHPSRAR